MTHTPATGPQLGIYDDPDVVPSLATIERIAGQLPEQTCTLTLSEI